MKIHLIYQKAREKIFIYFFNMLPSRAAHPPLWCSVQVSKNMSNKIIKIYFEQKTMMVRGEKKMMKNSLKVDVQQLS